MPRVYNVIKSCPANSSIQVPHPLQTEQSHPSPAKNLCIQVQSPTWELEPNKNVPSSFFQLKILRGIY